MIDHDEKRDKIVIHTGGTALVRFKFLESFQFNYKDNNVTLPGSLCTYLSDYSSSYRTPRKEGRMEGTRDELQKNFSINLSVCINVSEIRGIPPAERNRMEFILGPCASSSTLDLNTYCETVCGL